ncbi:MAG: Uncharacterized protein CEN91_111 [Candidatus Berkelbacteria bacterium Licking1014_85]|uniref:Uncharacterized protein n=1 Tax=Candidatus Berkelbacteria bacterium Licking1014_85 TaxID=2017148 RepID=A0A554LLS1_9BACT|nr:MAG: Uncharacterized protein CEN91_111 [Candidatus Berkelbacteria bacterium Licking1014_85]
MDLKKTPLAIAVFFSVISLICGLAVWIIPGAALSVASSWMHGIDVSTIWNPNVDIVSLVYGIISAFIASYIGAWIFVKIYKTIAK